MNLMRILTLETIISYYQYSTSLVTPLMSYIFLIFLIYFDSKQNLLYTLCKILILFQQKFFMLPQSYKTMNQNWLKTKIKPFREKYAQSLSRTNQKTSMQNLASSVYTLKRNNSFVLQKRVNKADTNPEQQLSTSALKGLDMRASHISNLSKHNTLLLIEKEQLQEKILRLKEEIAKDTKIKNRAQTSWKIAENNLNYTNQSCEQLSKKSAKLNQNIYDVKQENRELRQEINQLKRHNNDKVNNINIQIKNVQDKSNEVNILKNNLISQQRKRNMIKDQLIKQQRLMDSLSIQTKELENQRAMVLLDINSSVVKNKL